MPTFLIVYGIVLLVVFVFGLLTSFDRLFGIVGIFIGFIYGFYVEQDGQIIESSFLDPNSHAIIDSFVSSNETQILVMLLGLAVVINVVLLIRRS